MLGRAKMVAWPVAIYDLNRANEYISNMKLAKRRCYIGEELVMKQNMLYVITPPYSQNLSRTMNAKEAGFYSFWYKEIIGAGASSRVQGLVKMLSPTKILKEKPKVLELADGKLRNVYV